MTTELEGKVAVVTGAAHGIGSAIAAALRDDGVSVHSVDILGVDIPGADVSGADVSGAATDVVDLTDSAAVADYFAGLGAVDILVNNAGGVCGQVGRALEEVPDADWHAVVNANLTTAFHCTRAVAAGMKKRGWGRIINISSGAGLGVSKTGIQAYASAKAGMIGFTRQMAHELGPHGITVNCIAPGFILSNPTTGLQWQSYGPDGQRELIRGIATRRLGEPADIANGVQFFASVRSGWVTGQIIAINGGSSFR